MSYKLMVIWILPVMQMISETFEMTDKSKRNIIELIDSAIGGEYGY
jgi:hypothetical protein